MDPNILLIVLDSVRFDRLASCGYHRTTMPTVDKLADEGCLFERAYATGPWTVPVHGSLFTGKMPSEHGAHRKHQHLSTSPGETLAGRLSSMDYSTVGFSANPWITDGFGFGTGFDELHDLTYQLPFEDASDPRDFVTDERKYDEGLLKVVENIRWCLGGNPIKRFANGIFIKMLLKNPVTPASQVNEEVQSWLLQHQERPFFMFINYMDAHEPYRVREEHIPDGSRLDAKLFDSPERVNIIPEPDVPDVVDDLYDSSLAYLDEQISQLFTHLENASKWSDTLIIIMGDHGQSLGENGYWGHGTYLFEELTHVPLIIRPPNSRCELPSFVNQLVTIADLPRFIGRYVGEPFEIKRDSTFPDLSQSNQKEKSSVLIESHGPRPGMESDASNAGYRAIVYDSWRLDRNLETGEFTITNITDSTMSSSQTPVHLSQSQAESKLLNFEQQFLDQLEQAEIVEDNGEIITYNKRQLRDLGYL